MDNLGAYLKSQREERGIGIEEIASITKIHVRSLELIEHSQWKSLPPEPFIRGFLSAYSRYVGLDPKVVLEKYHLETHPPEVVAPVLETHIPTSNEEDSLTTESEREEAEEQTLAYELPRKKNQWKIWAGAALAALILVLMPFLFGGKTHSNLGAAKNTKKEENKTTLVSDSEQRESVQTLVSKASTEKTEPQPTTPKPAPIESKAAETRTVAVEAKPATPALTATVPPTETTPDAAPVPVVHTLVVKVKDKSWSKVVIDGKPAVQKMLSPDETYTYTAGEKIKLVLGNSAGAEILHNGENVEGTKIDGTIRQFIFPANSRFPQDPFKRKVASPEASSDTAISTDTGLPKEDN